MSLEPKPEGNRRRWRRRVAGMALAGVTLLVLLHGVGPKSSPRMEPAAQAPAGTSVMPVHADGLDGDFFFGASASPRRAVILLGGSEGGKSWNEHPEFIRELVEMGFGVLSLGYFGTVDLPAELRAIPLEYFGKAFHWLAQQEGRVIPNEYVVVGVSRGAELGLLLGSRYPEVKAVVAIAPSSVVFPGPPTGAVDALLGQHSAWSSGGQELSFVPVRYSWATLRGMVSGQRTRMFEQALQDAARVQAAAIPVEQIRGPILLASFTRDQIWPSTPMSEQLMQRLRDRQFRFPYEHGAYDAGHSEWSIPSCHSNLLRFLRTQALPPSRRDHWARRGLGKEL